MTSNNLYATLVYLQYIPKNTHAILLSFVILCFFPQFLRFYNIHLGYTEMEMMSYWRNFHHWLHGHLSFWPILVQPVMEISPKLRLYCFSVLDQQWGSSNPLAISQRNKHVIITSKAHFDVIITYLLRCVFDGPEDMRWNRQVPNHCKNR